MTAAGPLVNPELDQDRAADLYDTWCKYGYVMFPQQRAVYRHLARRCAWRSVLEAGCGDGVGGMVVAQRARSYTGTDKLAANVHFARCLHPYHEDNPLLRWDVWDLARPWHGPPAESVIAVECVEHVADPGRALAHLLAAAERELWISTPNGAVKHESPPSNPYHVAEYAPAEVLAMLKGLRVEVLHWETFEPVAPDAEVNPLVYRVLKGV